MYDTSKSNHDHDEKISHYYHLAWNNISHSRNVASSCTPITHTYLPKNWKTAKISYIFDLAQCMWSSFRYLFYPWQTVFIHENIVFINSGIIDNKCSVLDPNWPWQCLLAHVTKYPINLTYYKTYVDIEWIITHLWTAVPLPLFKFHNHDCETESLPND